MFVEILKANVLAADFEVDLENKTVSNYHKYTDDWLYWPFTCKDIVTYDMFISFLKRRCPEHGVGNMTELLRMWELEEFDPIAITKKTHGLMHDDFLWIRYDEEEVEYDEIQIRSDYPDYI